MARNSNDAGKGAAAGFALSISEDLKAIDKEANRAPAWTRVFYVALIPLVMVDWYLLTDACMQFSDTNDMILPGLVALTLTTATVLLCWFAGQTHKKSRNPEWAQEYGAQSKILTAIAIVFTLAVIAATFGIRIFTETHVYDGSMLNQVQSPPPLMAGVQSLVMLITAFVSFAVRSAVAHDAKATEIGQLQSLKTALNSAKDSVMPTYTQEKHDSHRKLDSDLKAAYIQKLQSLMADPALATNAAKALEMADRLPVWNP